MTRRKSGDGSIKKTKSGKFEMRKMHGYLPNGTPRILQVTGTSETDCKRKMKKKEEECDAKYLSRYSVEVNKITLSELCFRHLREHLGQRDRLKPKAADRRESTIRNQIAPYKIGRLQVLTVTSFDVDDHIEMLIQENRLSVSSIVKTLDVINASYKWANNKQFFNYNPCTPVLDSLKARLKNLDTRNSSEGIVKVLSDEQVEIIKKYVEEIKYNDETYRYLVGLGVLFLLNTGMRVGELCALRWCNWSRKTNTLTVNKTRSVPKNRDKGDRYIPREDIVKNDKSRTICLNAEAVAVLEEMYRVTRKKEMDDYILVNKLNKPSNPTNGGTNINAIYARAGLPQDITGAHILRRTCATKMYNEGCSVEDIAAYLGDTPDTIRKYYISLTKTIIIGDEVLNAVPFPVKK